MSRKKMIRVSLAALTVCLPVLAGAEEKTYTQTEMNLDSYKEFQKADAKLNEVYKKFLGTLDDKEAKQKLIDAQRLWIKFRDAEIESEGDDYRGGSIVPLIHNTCAKRLTEERISQLTDRQQP